MRIRTEGTEDRPASDRIARGHPGQQVGRWGRADRQSDHELAAKARAGTVGRDGPAVQLREALDQREPDSEAAAGPLGRPLYLVEEVEDTEQSLGRHPDPGVAHLEHELVGLPGHDQIDPAAGIGVLGGVGQEVGQDLLKPGRVGHQGYRLIRQGNGELMPAGLDQLPDILDGAGHDLGRVHRLPAERDGAARESGRIEQILDQSRHVADLPVDHVAGLREHRLIDGVGAQQVGTGLDRGQGIA